MKVVKLFKKVLYKSKLLFHHRNRSVWDLRGYLCRRSKWTWDITRYLLLWRRHKI